MTQTSTTITSEFIDLAIASKNIDMMKGIAETVTDLTDAQIKALLLSGSLEVAKVTIASLSVGSNVFAEVAQRAIALNEIEMGVTVSVLNTDGTLLDVFLTNRESCGTVVPADQTIEVRFAKDNLARVILGLNLDGLDNAAVTNADIVMELDKALLSNQNAPVEVVTPFLTNTSDILRAKAFVHVNTDNATIVAVMTADDAASLNIDGFKLSMISNLNTDAMIQGNDGIVAYLLGAGQSVPVQYAMFKNYVSVVLNGGSIVAGVNTSALIAAYIK
jgi:hypothetical protein